jgi:hypothetical protein
MATERGDTTSHHTRRNFIKTSSVLVAGAAVADSVQAAAGKRKTKAVIVGTGDTRLRDMVFTPGMPDPYHQTADHMGGAYACVPGFAAIKSIDEKRMVEISELI